MNERRIISDKEIDWMEKICALHAKTDKTAIETRLLEDRTKQLRVSALNASQRMIAAYHNNDSFAGLMIDIIRSWGKEEDFEESFIPTFEIANTAGYFDTPFAKIIDTITQECIKNPFIVISYHFSMEHEESISLSAKDVLLGILSYSYKDFRASIPA